METTKKLVLNVLEGKVERPPPIWMMRQAGRYLPEYKKVRAQQSDFLSFCYDVDSAVEVTLQPIRNFGFDAAILFSDIFVVPDAMGYDVKFEESIGPILQPLDFELVNSLDSNSIRIKLDPVFQIISQLKLKLPNSTTLFGFCGAPWTIACYAIGGRSTPYQTVARSGAYQNPELIEEFISKLTSASIDYLNSQIEAGADVVQIFDTWAGVLDEEGFEKWVIIPTKKIVAGVKKVYPDAKIIGFPKGVSSMLDHYVKETKIDAVGIDWTVPFEIACNLQKNGVPVQGNLDPMRLKAGGTALNEAIDGILKKLGDGPLIFNLGHGITPDTPVENVHQMVQRVRSFGTQIKAGR